MHIGIGIKEHKISAALVAVNNCLTTGEEVLAIFKAGSRFMTEYSIVTDRRIIELNTSMKSTTHLNLTDLDRESLLEKRSDSSLKLNLKDGKTFKISFNVLKGASQDRDEFFGCLLSQLSIASVSPERRLQNENVKSFSVDSSTNEWPGTTLVGGTPRKKATVAILKQCYTDEERPWLILICPGSGLIAAFEDRLVLIKTGSFNSLMAGSFGGERTAVFFYKDITGIEYNAGILNGVLEILTPSYSGTAHKDFWTGTMKSRNDNSNDPFTLSNTMPIDRFEYREFTPHLNEIRKRIADSKNPAVKVEIHQKDTLHQGKSLTEELLDLKKLHEEGVLSADEFALAKARVIG